MSRPRPNNRPRPVPAATTPDGADLHVHTTHSDGACSPCEVVVAASRAHLAALAITDHDTVTALDAARREATRWGVELVAGVEWTAEHEGREVHLLGYFFRDDDPALRGACDRLRDARADRVAAMAARLGALGLSVDLHALRAAFPRATLGRRHLAAWLARTGQAASERDAFARWLGDGGPATVPATRLPWRVAIDLTRAAGGVVALAHPPIDLRLETLRSLADGGLSAIEVTGHSIGRRHGARWSAWADALGLVPVAGSDFHAADRHGRWVGSVRAPLEWLERLRRRAADAGESPET